MCSFGHHICSYWRNGCFTRERGSCGASSFADPEQLFKQEGQYHRKTKCADEWEDDRSQDAFLWSGGRSGVLHHLDEIQNFVEYRQKAQPTAMAANWREKRYQEMAQIYEDKADDIPSPDAREALRDELSSQSQSISWVEVYCDHNGVDWFPHLAAVAVLDELVRNLQDVYAPVGEEFWKLKLKLLN